VARKTAFCFSPRARADVRVDAQQRKSACAIAAEPKRTAAIQIDLSKSWLPDQRFALSGMSGS